MGNVFLKLPYICHKTPALLMQTGSKRLPQKLGLRDKLLLLM